MGDVVIRGVQITALERIAVAGGSVLHAMKASSVGYAGFAEGYFSEIDENAIKAWRCHRRATLNLVVPRGNVRFVVYDARPESATCGIFGAHQIGEDNYARLTVQPDLWLAFQGRGPGTSLILDITNEEYDPKEVERKDLHEIEFSW